MDEDGGGEGRKTEEIEREEVDVRKRRKEGKMGRREKERKGEEKTIRGKEEEEN